MRVLQKKNHVEYYNSIKKKLKLKLSNNLYKKEYQNTMIDYFSKYKFEQIVNNLLK